MRYWLLSLAIALILGIGASQTISVSAQGKDLKKKEPPKDGKDKKKDAKEAPAEFNEPTEVLGKPFEYWKKKIHSDDPSERELAIKTVLFFGANKAYEAVPDIIFQLNRQKKVTVDLSVRVNGIQALSTIFRYRKNPDEKYLKEAYAIYKEALKDPQVILRMQTMKALPYLGPIARDAIEDVLKLGKDPVSWEIRKEAIPVLIVLASPEVPGGATNQLAPSVMVLLKNRANKDNEKSQLVRQAALQGMAALATPGLGVPKELTNGLYDPALAVRLTALQAIAGMSHRLDAQEKKSAEARLIEYLREEKDKALNMWTHAVIMTINNKVTPQEMNPILKKLSDPDVSLRLLAFQIIGMMGPEAKPLAFPPVRDMIHDPEISLGVAAIHTCVSLHAIEVKPVLQKIIDDKKSNDLLHDAALEALHAFDLYEKMEKEKKGKDKKADDKK